MQGFTPYWIRSTSRRLACQCHSHCRKEVQLRSAGFPGVQLKGLWFHLVFVCKLAWVHASCEGSRPQYLGTCLPIQKYTTFNLWKHWRTHLEENPPTLPWRIVPWTNLCRTLSLPSINPPHPQSTRRTSTSTTMTTITTTRAQSVPCAAGACGVEAWWCSCLLLVRLLLLLLFLLPVMLLPIVVVIPVIASGENVSAAALVLVALFVQ